MCCTEQRVKLFCLEILSRTLARVGSDHWKISKGNLFENHKSKCKRNLGMRMDTCEILIVLLFIIMAVVPLAIVMTMVELLNRRRMAMQQMNRIGSRRILNSISMSTL